MHACRSPLCHEEEGWKKTVALNKYVFIFKRERGSLICLPTETPLEDFSSFKGTKKGGERERQRERCS